MASNGKFALLGVGLLVFLFSLVLPAHGEDVGWKAKWEKIVEAAKKEGQINSAEGNSPFVLCAGELSRLKKPDCH